MVYKLDYKGVEIPGNTTFRKNTGLGLVTGIGIAYQINEKREVSIDMLLVRNKGVMNLFDSKETCFRIGIPIVSYN